MVSQEDVETVETLFIKFRNAMNRMHHIHNQSTNPGVTINAEAYADDQEQMKAALAHLVHKTNDMVDTTDVYDPTINAPGRGGDPDTDPPKVTLPNQALSRKAGGKGLPDLSEVPDL